MNQSNKNVKIFHEEKVPLKYRFTALLLKRSKALPTRSERNETAHAFRMRKLRQGGDKTKFVEIQRRALGKKRFYETFAPRPRNRMRSQGARFDHERGIWTDGVK